MSLTLQTKVASRRGTSIRVNGTSYKIDAQGVIRDVLQLDRDKLVQSDEWTENVVEIQVVVPPSERKRKGAREFVDAVTSDPAFEAQIQSIRSFHALLSLAEAKGFYFSKKELDEAKEAYLARNPDKKAAPPAPQQPAQPVQQEPSKLHVTDKHVAFLESRGYKVGSLDGATQFMTSLSAGDLEALQKDVSLWDPNQGKSANPPAASVQPEPLPAHCFSEDLADSVVLPEETTGHWPHPEQNMAKAYLLRMARAYKVKTPPNTGKPNVIKKILEKMYDEEDAKTPSEK